MNLLGPVCVINHKKNDFFLIIPFIFVKAIKQNIKKKYNQYIINIYIMAKKSFNADEYNLVVYRKKFFDIFNLKHECCDDILWSYKEYYLYNNGKNNIDKDCIMCLNPNNLLILLNVIKDMMKYNFWSHYERRTQLSNDMSHWRCSICKHGDNCKNKLNYKCGYFHSCDNSITPDILQHYKSYPSYIPNARKMKLYNALFDTDGNVDTDKYALTSCELRILPYNHRKIFTWLHIRIVTDFRIQRTALTSEKKTEYDKKYYQEK